MNKEVQISVQSLGRKQLRLTPQLTRTCYFYKIGNHQTRNNLLHTVLLIDGSASMLPYLEDLKQIVHETIHQLNVSHKLSILLFGNEFEDDWLVNQEFIIDKDLLTEELHKRLEERCGDEWTVLSSALETTFAMLTKQKDKEEIQLIVVTDGHLYPSSHSIVVEQSRCYGWMLDLAKQHVMTHIVGIGTYNLNFLTWLATTSRTGDFYPYQNLKTYRTHFKQWKSSLKKGAHQEICLFNKDYFLMAQTLHLHQPKQLLTLPQLVVTFDETLKLEQQEVPASADEVSKEIEQHFKLAYGYYLIKQRQIDDASFLLQETELFPIIHQGYSINEISRSLAAINQARYTRQALRVQSFIPLSVFELIQMILDDSFSQLYYKNEARFPIKQDDGRVTFTAHDKLYFPIIQVRASTTKQNVTFTVKVEGVAKQNQTDLKLDCYIFRQYFFIEGGNLKLQTLACRLSPTLRKRFVALKLISGQLNHESEIDLIDLSRLKLTHFQCFSSDISQMMAQQLYELEQLTLRQQVLKTLISTNQSTFRLDKHQIDESINRIRSQYHVSPSGLFIPRVKSNALAKRDAYDESFTKWSIENFPKQSEWQRLYENIQQQVLMSQENPLQLLYTRLNETKKQRLILQNKIYLLRIQSQLCGQPIFYWDEVYEREVKKQGQHTYLTTGKMLTSKQKIGEIVVCENKYYIHSTT
ncbi:vWA domain-containing protein [Turicibacter bilis]|uniref:VWA domain-containing protein n=1 Tax=Turicibacter bilis TaxID=2735723 RepID=A0ABY5JJD5_9FIRM|nr:vWA domain-containing protein [Turicibacter bilis]MBS3201116.1 VWA domain-containing protein [Turicibacter bilis]UUF06807.1 VWA domain-containing protein [Turicibacter bilis]